MPTSILLETDVATQILHIQIQFIRIDNKFMLQAYSEWWDFADNGPRQNHRQLHRITSAWAV